MEHKENLEFGEIDLTKVSRDDKALLIKLNQTIKKVTESIEDDYHFNTSIAATMELINETQDYKVNILEGGKTTSESKKIFAEVIKNILVMLSPFTPHFCDELWEEMGNTGYLFNEKWPSYDEKLTVSSEVVMAVQVNGKVRATITININEDEESIKEKALTAENVKNHTAGKEIVKVIIIKGKIVNIVVK